METKSLRNARTHVTMYTSEVLDDHREAMECRDCEDFLQLGIDAFNWIQRARRRVTESKEKSDSTFDSESNKCLIQLYTEWLEVTEYAEGLIRVQLSRLFEIDNLESFRECCSNARQILGDLKDEKREYNSEVQPTTIGLRPDAFSEDDFAEMQQNSELGIGVNRRPIRRVPIS